MKIIITYSLLLLSECVECHTVFLRCSNVVNWDRKGIRSGRWFDGGDDLTAALYNIAPVVTTTFIILISNSNKIQNGDILIPVYSGCPGKWP